jgi:hypothetical protein
VKRQLAEEVPWGITNSKKIFHVTEVSHNTEKSLLYQNSINKNTMDMSLGAQGRMSGRVKGTQATDPEPSFLILKLTTHTKKASRLSPPPPSRPPCSSAFMLGGLLD